MIVSKLTDWSLMQVDSTCYQSAIFLDFVSFFDFSCRAGNFHFKLPVVTFSKILIAMSDLNDCNLEGFQWNGMKPHF